MPKVKLDQEPSLREKILFAASLVIVAIMFANNLWQPARAEAKKIRSEAASVRSQADAMDKLLAAAREQIQRMQATSEEAPKIDEAVKRILERPALDPVTEINTTVEKLGSRMIARRVRIGRIEPGQQSDAGGYSIVPIQLELTGPYTAVQNYLDAIESVDRALVVRRLEMKGGGESGGELSTSLSVDLYIVKR